MGRRREPPSRRMIKAGGMARKVFKARISSGLVAMCGIQINK